MNIDKLTLGQVKELQSLLGNGAQPSGSEIYKSYIGKFVIVRSRNEGINAGTVLMADETGIVLQNARRFWHHKPADKATSWYEGVANSGLSGDSKISSTVAEKAIIEGYSITLCSNIAKASIEGAKSHVQS